MPYKKCIYCLRVDSSNKSWSGEHHFPAFLGCPNTDQFRREVCPDCNNDTSFLESFFKENTPEGYLSAMYKLGRGDGYRTTGKFKVDISTGELRISPEHLFRADIATKRLELPTQSTFVAGERRFTVFRDYKEKEFQKKVKWLNSQEVEYVCLHKQSRDPIRKPSSSSKILSNSILPAGNFGPVVFSFKYLLNRTIKRFIAKIAFNYFAKCALPAYDSIVYDNIFGPLRNYIMLDDTEFSARIGADLTLVPLVKQEPVLFNGSKLKPADPVHSFKIYQSYSDVYRARIVVAEINLFSLNNYFVHLGFYPFSTINYGSFGCGHVFDIGHKTWTRVNYYGEIEYPNDFSILR